MEWLACQRIERVDVNCHNGTSRENILSCRACPFHPGGLAQLWRHGQKSHTHGAGEGLHQSDLIRTGSGTGLVTKLWVFSVRFQ